MIKIKTALANIWSNGSWTLHHLFLILSLAKNNFLTVSSFSFGKSTNAQIKSNHNSFNHFYVASNGQLPSSSSPLELPDSTAARRRTPISPHKDQNSSMSSVLCHVCSNEKSSRPSPPPLSSGRLTRLPPQSKIDAQSINKTKWPTGLTRAASEQITRGQQRAER